MTLSIDEKKAIIKYRIQKAWTEEEVQPFFNKTKDFLARMEKLITLK